MSTTDILLNSAALNSLKRSQLVALCKQHGLKAIGKNSDLVGKLQEFAVNNPKREAATTSLVPFHNGSNASDHTGSEDTVMQTDIDFQEAERAKMRPSEIWEVIEEETMEEMQRLQEESLNKKGSLLSTSSKNSRSRIPGEFGSSATLSKPPSVSSSLKSLANSFKWGSTKGSIPPQTSNIPEPMPVESEIGPSNAEDADINMADTSIELDHQTVRLVKFNPQPSYPSPPPLRPFRPSLPLAPLSPDPKASLYPPIPKGLTYTPVKPSPLGMRASLLPSSPKAGSTEPFIFGSPAPRHSVTNADFDAAASSVLEEMNRRLGLKGAVPVSSSILQGRELGKADETIEAAEQARARIKAARPIKTPKRFSDAHAQQFAKMESIVDYAARLDKQKTVVDKPLGPIKRKRKSNVLDDGSLKKTAGQKRSGMPGGFDDEEEVAQPREAKRARVSEAPGGETGDGPRVKIAEDGQKVEQDEADRDRDAIKRKLEASRARRRSSRGRPSMGGRPSSGKPAPQAKKGLYSRFGFLKGAVGAVKNVWNRGAGAPTTTTKPATSASTTSKPTVSASVTRPSNTTSVSGARKASAGLNRGLIPSFGSSAKSRASSSSRPTSTNQKVGGAKSRIAQISSVGFKRAAHLDPGEAGSTTGSTTSTARRKRSSTFMAPTQSSLARMQNITKPTSNGDNLSSDTAGKLTHIPIPASAAIKSPAMSSGRREPEDITNMRSPSTGRRPLPTIPPQIGMKEKSYGSLTARDREDITERENVPNNNPSGLLRPPAQVDSRSTSATSASGSGSGSLSRKPSHRPRISRTHIVAKLHARRLASDSSRRSSASGRSVQRKSMSGAASAGGVKASMVVSRHSGAGSMAAKRRVRASEVARRKSRAPPIAASSAMDVSG